ncbi:putative RNA-binding protein [Paramicrosporidium saccamoebae]|uniref:Putative RNA-binding protein n=1 Tax=Paramicrosporidium saccamoebae TaxID=1246581 RepID=A0A2H9TMY7_9FUNG|nr:putative RNA-binding protein [Paramicrosporidium saccamoebae]
MAPKKEKAQKMSLADFTKTLQVEGEPTTAAWADEEFELPSGPLGQERPSYDNRPGRVPARGYGRDEAPQPVVIDQHALPRAPPFMAFVGNLSYEAGEEDIREFFAGIAIKGIRFPRSAESGPRGFGYVEFHSVEGLTEGLLRSRPCRIDLASAKSEERESRIAAGNWRDGHQVVESSRMERAAPRGAAPVFAPSGNWRDTAKPVDAEKPAFRSAPVETKPAMTGRKPEIKLLPRTVPVESDGQKLATGDYQKSSKPNPFGAAKPREIVLAEKHAEPKE